MSRHFAAHLITFSVLDFLAVMLTIFRLGFRLKIQRFWWEDAWAAVASLCTAVLICCLLIATKSVDSDLIQLSGKLRLYMITSIIWSVRMSIVFSIIRITSSTLLRRLLFITAACFVLFLAVTFGLQSGYCVRLTAASFEDPGSLSCISASSILIFELITNTFADTVTFLFSLKLLWRVKLPPRQRKMVLYLFSSSRYLCICSLAHAISQLASPRSPVQQILAYLQVTVSMLVCNLVVVVTFIYRVFWISSDYDSSYNLDSSYDDDFTTSLPRTQDLTTVDLEVEFSGITSELRSNSIAPATNLENSSGLIKGS